MFEEDTAESTSRSELQDHSQASSDSFAHPVLSDNLGSDICSIGPATVAEVLRLRVDRQPQPERRTPDTGDTCRTS